MGRYGWPCRRGSPAARYSSTGTGSRTGSSTLLSRCLKQNSSNLVKLLAFCYEDDYDFCVMNYQRDLVTRWISFGGAYMSPLVFKFVLLNRKISTKFLLAFLKTLSNFKDCSERASNFCSGFPLLSCWSIFAGVPVKWWTFMACCRKNFQDHRRLSKQLLESQATFGKPEQAPWRGLLADFDNYCRKWFHKSKQNIFGFSSLKENNILWKLSARSCKTDKKISSHDTIPLRTSATWTWTVSSMRRTLWRLLAGQITWPR